MPRTVDHDHRRRELVETAWRVVARRGLTGATLRQIAEEAGYANGALKPYFPTKNDLLDATYAHVLERTQRRIDTALADAVGVEALRRLCLEVLPVDADLLEEARLVISFWDLAAREEAEARASAATLEAWRSVIVRALAEAQTAGEVRPGLVHESVADLVLGWLFGTQVTAVVGAWGHDSDGLRAQLEALLGLIGRA